MKNKHMSIGEVASRTGLSVSAIRHYETEGLVHPMRSAAGQRVFARSDLRRLSFVMIAQKVGFSLPQIRAELDRLPNGRTPTRADWTRISTGFRGHLEAQIKTLELLRDRMDGCIGCGCLSLRSCGLYNAEDRIAAKGQGPRYLMGDTPRRSDEMHS